MLHRLLVIFLLGATLLIASGTAPTSAKAAPEGFLDPAFGDNGIAQLNFGGGATDVAVQPDGKILVGGFDDDGSHPDYYTVVVARLNPDGSLDTSFADGGKFVSNRLHISTNTYPRHGALLLRRDGKIVLGGTTPEDNFVFELLQLNSDGSIDTTFGVDGLVRADVSGDQSAVLALAEQADGKIVASGYAFALAGSANSGWPASPLRANLIARLVLAAP